MTVSEAAGLCSRLFRWLVLFLVLLGGIAKAGEPAANTDLLLFANGDRLTGLYLKHEDGFIHFESDLLGAIRVPAADAMVVSGAVAPSLDGMPMEEVAQTGAPGDEAEEAEAGEDAPAAEREPDVAAADPEEAYPGALYRIPVLRDGIGFAAPILDALKRFHLWPTWKSRVTFGHVWQYGQVDETSMNARFTTEKRVSDEYEALFDSRYNYGKQRRADGVTSKTRDNYSLRMRYRHIISKYYFAQSNTRYEKDLIKRIRHEAEQSLGLGWRVFEKDQMRATLTPALSTRYQDRSHEDINWFVYMTMFQDFEYHFNTQVAFYQEFAYSMEATDSENYNVDFTGRLETKLTAKLSMNFIWQFKYDNAVSAGIDPSSHRTTAALAFDF